MKKLYFDRKRDAADVGQMLEKTTGERTKLVKTRKGWYCDNSINRFYLTKDGVTVESGFVVYTPQNKAFEIAERIVKSDGVYVHLRPITSEESDRNKDVRDGILWYVKDSDALKSIRTKRFRNNIDGRDLAKHGDVVFVEATNRFYRIKREGKYKYVVESMDVLEQYETVSKMQCVEVIDDELRVINDFEFRRGKHPLCSLYSRPLTYMERIEEAVNKIGLVGVSVIFVGVWFILRMILDFFDIML